MGECASPSPNANRRPRPSSAEPPRPEASPRWPLVVVGIVVLFNLVVLRAEARPVQNLNDASVHRSMIAWASDRIEEGHLPLDGWYPDLALGSSRFHHYQSLPHVLTGVLALAIGSERALSWTMYLGMALWPIAVYAGGRLLGWDRWICAIAAAASPLIVSEPTLGYEWGSYAWRGYGTWTQLWGMWLLPFAWGLSWRAVAKGRSYWLAALVLALTVACHLLTGYLALLSLGVFALVKWGELLRRIGRAALIGIGSLFVAAWVVVPLLADRLWTVNDEYSRGKIYYDSFGAKRILTWFASGELFDRGRPPMITILVAVGILVALWRYRRDERARVLLFLFLVSLVLFFGRPTLGPVLRLLPGSGDLFLRRFVFGVHLAGLYLAGFGAVTLGRIAWDQLQRFRALREQPVAIAALAVAGVVLFLAPGFIERTAWASQGAEWIGEQAVADDQGGADVAALVDIARARGPGRFYAGMRSNWGSAYEVGQVPVYVMLLNEGTEGVGFVRPTWSLSAPFEYRFTDTNPVALRPVRRALPDPRRGARRPPSRRRGSPNAGATCSGKGSTPATSISSTSCRRSRPTGRTSGCAGRIGSDRTSRPGARTPGIAFEGEPAPEATVSADDLPDTPAGTVVSEDVDLRDGRATATVIADRPAMVMLKASFDPRWQVTVDGIAVAPEMIAPSFVGRTVPAGRHVVRFVYEPFPRYDLLLPFGALTLLGLAVLPAWLARRRGAGCGARHARARRRAERDGEVPRRHPDLRTGGPARHRLAARDACGERRVELDGPRELLLYPPCARPSR